MANNYVGTVQMVQMECYKCNVHFGMTKKMNDAQLKLRRRGEFYCPNGHCQNYAGDNAETKLRRENERLLQGRAQLHDVIDEKNKEIRHQKDTVRAEKGAKTKLKRRIAHGNCPNCKRSFSNLARHMKDQHPEEVTNVS